ncbi:monoglyceride lipase-like [Tubulanus polymorphus]|uniref:monoglyceride lipase-like n=1 Tax=Tubulanus polymorphus TaxID=672921 RepID=UPI003DA2FD52
MMGDTTNNVESAEVNSPPAISPLGTPYADLPHFVNEDGEYIFTKCWEPSGPPRALIYIGHGGGEHCARYEELASILVNEGYYVFSNDQVGHGQSSGERMHIEEFTVYVRDTKKYIESVKERFPDVDDLFIIGFSLGASIAIRLAIENKYMFRGLVTLAPALIAHNEFASAWKMKVVQVLAKVMPKMQGEDLKSTVLSRDLDRVEAYNKDPLNWHGGLRTKWSLELMENKNYLENNMKKLEVPILLLHGERDVVCDVAGSKMIAEKSVSNDKTLKTYPGCYHQLLDEPAQDRGKVIKDIIDWINERN